MIHEIAVFPVKPGQADAFERAFARVSHLLDRAKGHEGHLLTQGVEQPSDFTLIVQWQSLEDHTRLFEASSDHEVFITALQPYLVAEPSVHHVRAAGSEGPGAARALGNRP